MLLLAGCIGGPDLEASGDPVVVTETGAVSYAPPQSPERAAAVAEMRAQAVAGETMPYPDVFQTARRHAARRARRAAARSPTSAAIEAELAAIAVAGRRRPLPRRSPRCRRAPQELQRLAAQAAAVRAQRP